MSQNRSGSEVKVESSITESRRRPWSHWMADGLLGIFLLFTVSAWAYAAWVGTLKLIEWIL